MRAAGPAAAAEEWPLAGVLAGRGIRPVSYAEWLRIETAEADLARELGRGERVKLYNAAAIWSASDAWSGLLLAGAGDRAGRRRDHEPEPDRDHHGCDVAERPDADV